MEERYREQMIARQRLAGLAADAPAVRAALDAAIAEVNGDKDDPKSFDALERLLEQWADLDASLRRISTEDPI